MDELRLTLLGGFRVTLGTRVVPPLAWPRPKSAELVKLLALAPGRQMAREQVMEALWPHLEPGAATNALHKTSSYTRRTLEATEAIVLRAGTVSLAPEATVITDAVEFERCATSALSGSDADACADAAALYTGELLPSDRYAEWVQEPRRRLQRLHAELLRCAGAWEELVEIDPTDELAHRQLMELHASRGNRQAALRQFRMLREALFRELSVLPSEATVQLYQRIARAPAEVAPVAIRSPLMGRTVELARARTLLRHANEQGRRGVVMVNGEIGAGKTAFCERLLEEMSEAGATTLRGTTSEACAGFAPIVEAVDRLLLARPDLVEALTPTARSTLSRLTVTLQGNEASAEALRRQQVLSAMTQLLHHAAEERPVVVLLDDIHHADASTLALVDYLSRSARYDRFALLLTCRPAPPPPVRALRKSLLSQELATEISLSPLSREESDELVRETLGERSSASIEERVWTVAGGNPLFSSLLIRSEEKRDASARETLAELIDDQLDALDEPLIDCLFRIALVGGDLSVEEMVALCEKPQKEAFALLDLGLERGVLRERGDRIGLGNPLLREALLQRVPVHRRQAEHAATARILSSVGAAPTRIAEQLVAAGIQDQAAEWLTEAARDAAARGAYGSGLRSVEKAVSLGADSPALLTLRAQLQLACGDPRAAHSFGPALDAAEPEQLDALRVQQAHAFLVIGDVAAASQVLADAKEPGDPEHRARYWAVQGTLHWLQGNNEAANEALERSHLIAIREQLPGELTEAVTLRALLAHTQGVWPELVRVDLLSGDEPLEQLAVAIHEGHLCTAERYLYGGHPYEEVARFARDLNREAESRGMRRAQAIATCLLGETELLTGKSESAGQHLEQAAELSAGVHAYGGQALALQRMAELEASRGEIWKARDLLRRSLDLARSSALGSRHVLQRIYGVRIRLARNAQEKLSELDEAERTLTGPHETCNACAITWAVPAATAAAQAGNPQRAEKYLAVAEQSARMFWQGGGWQAALCEARAELALSQGENETARQHLEDAIGIYERVEQTPDLERCRSRLAEL